MMSELINKMNIDELRVYAKNLENVRIDQMDVNYVSERIIFQFSELVRSILDLNEFKDKYEKALNGFHEFDNKMMYKYYPPHEMVPNTDGTWNISEEQAKILADMPIRGGLS